MRRAQPQRTCVGCGRRAGKEELVRLAVAAPRERDGRAPRVATIDRDGRLGGRGAYLCRDLDGEHPSVPVRVRTDCLERALRRRSVGRTLRASVTLDPKLVESVGR